MDHIIELFKMDLASIIIGIFYLLSAIIAMSTIIGKFSELIGKPVRWIKKKQEDHELLTQTARNLDLLQQKHEEDVRQSIRHDDMIREELKKLTDMFIDKEINDLRWEIINFSTTVAEGKPCNKDSYKHCIRTYEKYEKLLAENGLENGEVDISMELIHESYKEKLKNGF